MFGRCSAALWIFRHDPMLAHARDERRQLKPYVIAWECRRCGKACGVTTLEPRWSLMARLRRQVSNKRSQAA